MSYSGVAEALRRARDKREIDLAAELQDALTGQDVVIEQARYVEGDYLSVTLGLPSRKYHSSSMTYDSQRPYLISDVLEIVPMVALLVEQDNKWFKLSAIQVTDYGSVHIGFHEFTLEKLALTFIKAMTRWNEWRSVFLNVLERQVPFAVDWRAFLRYETGMDADQRDGLLDGETRSQAYRYLHLASRSLLHSVLNSIQLEHREIGRLLGWLEDLYTKSTAVECYPEVGGIVET